MSNVTRDAAHNYTADGVTYPSVTTVLSSKEIDTTGLEIWKSKNSGIGDKADYRHLRMYAQKRGTLLHYHVLNQLTDKELWSDEEARSFNTLLDADEDSSVVYSLLRHDKRDTGVENRDMFYDACTDITVTDILEKDKRWFMDAADEILAEVDATPIAVEQLLHSDTLQLGGQVDLVYEDCNGDTVVADLKTSSSLREKHILQGYTYAAMVIDCDVVETVDRIEVWQLNPELEAMNVHTHSDTDLTEWHTDATWWRDEWDNYEYQSHEDIFGEIYSVREGYEDV